MASLAVQEMCFVDEKINFPLTSLVKFSTYTYSFKHFWYASQCVEADPNNFCWIVMLEDLGSNPFKGIKQAVKISMLYIINVQSRTKFNLVGERQCLLPIHMIMFIHTIIDLHLYFLYYETTCAFFAIHLFFMQTITCIVVIYMYLT